MAIDRKLADAVYRNSLGAFVYAAFEAFYPGLRLMPNWHIDTVCYAVQRMVRGESANRMIVNLPPRTLKSFILSVCLPAWLLGRNPDTRILCASYSRELAEKFSRDCRALMETPFYRRLFPRTRLNPRKASEGEFETTRRGYRLATSVGGTLTGRGGDVLIVDDPLKADDANSQVALDGTAEWFRNTALSRLDSPAKSLIIVTMQRLHRNDLSGLLIEQGWPCLAIPAVAEEPADYLIGKDETYHRPLGELLQPKRDSVEGYDAVKRQVGSRIWAAQYQQNPTPAEGTVIKAGWLMRYDFDPQQEKFRKIVVACDPSGKAGANNDYTAVTVVGIRDNRLHLLEVARGHWTVMQMQERILTLCSKWNAHLAIVEDTSSGMGLIQLLKDSSRVNVIGRHPDTDKETRMARHEGRFEAGRIFLPKEAPWLAAFESELLAFPNGKYDDQVDALLLFLDWHAEQERRPKPMVAVVGPRCFIDGQWYGPDFLSGLRSQ